jgi:hypothetical protein
MTQLGIELEYKVIHGKYYRLTVDVPSVEAGSLITARGCGDASGDFA